MAVKWMPLQAFSEEDSTDFRATPKECQPFSRSSSNADGGTWNHQMAVAVSTPPGENMPSCAVHTDEHLDIEQVTMRVREIGKSLFLQIATSSCLQFVSRRVSLIAGALRMLL